MSEGNMQKQCILIVDDSDMNRAILMDMLCDDYEIMEAEDGLQAIEKLKEHRLKISLVLLDLMMPKMNGFEVLDIMNSQDMIEDIAVIMISAETRSEHMEKAYDLGVTDFISRPFDAIVVRKRIINTLILCSKQKKLADLVMEQLYEKEYKNRLMIDILSHIVEFRNGESGKHVQNVNILVGLLLDRLVEKSDVYALTPSDIANICTASALHDVGKISIPETILNKPGQLTDEEFETMKTHTLIGAQMMTDIADMYQNEELIRIAYEICRWHHERYDGSGYPDGLKGESIPISAQVVALADVYDALTSERVYKKALPHEQAIHMICNGECGAFQPLLLSCLCDIAPDISEQLKQNSGYEVDRRTIHRYMNELHNHEDLSVSSRTLRLIEYEREKYRFFASLNNEILFEYTLSPPMLRVCTWGAEQLNIDECITYPKQSEQILHIMQVKDWESLSYKLRHTTPQAPETALECQIRINEEKRWVRIMARAIWSSDGQYQGAIGKFLDIHGSRLQMDDLQKRADHDVLTGLYNLGSAKALIMKQLAAEPNANYALATLDLDFFKKANDDYGHSFGNEVLVHVAKKLQSSVRKDDIVARIGGDEFMLFFMYKYHIDALIDRIFHAVCEVYETFPISTTIGIATTKKVEPEFDALFQASDQALYSAKRSGRGKYCFYEPSMSQVFHENSETMKGERS